jgi:hypothetical protein
LLRLVRLRPAILTTVSVKLVSEGEGAMPSAKLLDLNNAGGPLVVRSVPSPVRPSPDLATQASFGLEDIARLLRENRRLQAEADRLEAENKQLRAENNDMKSTLELVEQYFTVRKALHG